ncbi:protein DsrB [Cronobacter muytjensii]|nr:protein DsrB [Cronobacter muytjensii]
MFLCSTVHFARPRVADIQFKLFAQLPTRILPVRIRLRRGDAVWRALLVLADDLNRAQQGVDIGLRHVWRGILQFHGTYLRRPHPYKYSPARARNHAPGASKAVLFYTGSIVIRGAVMNVNDRVTVKTDGGPRRPGVVLAVEPFNEGTMYLVSLEDYPLGIWFFNEKDHPDGIFVEKVE